VKTGPVEVTKKGGVKLIRQKKDLEGKMSGLHDKGILAKQQAHVLHILDQLDRLAIGTVPEA